MYYLNYFFLFSIIGHFIESFFFSNGNSGILLSYWTPIYGIGVIIIIFVNKFVNKSNFKYFFKIITLFIFSSIVLSSIEALGGYLIKFIFNTELWNYSNHKFNIGSYTSLEISLIWGLSSILLIYFIKPFLDKKISKIPKYLTYSLVVLFFIDCIATIIIKK